MQQFDWGVLAADVAVACAWLATVVWVDRSAARRGVDSKAFATLAFVLPFVGLVPYLVYLLIVRPVAALVEEETEEERAPASVARVPVRERRRPRFLSRGDRGAALDGRRLVEEILEEAVASRATDVHLELSPEGMRCRFRIDGILHDRASFNPEEGNRIVVAAKAMARMDVAKKLVPQDGSFGGRFGSKECDVRVSSSPGVHGEKLVLRILDREVGLMTLEELGFAPDILPRFGELLSRPHGMILDAGPTGSGKTTTLYASIRRLDVTSLNVVTVEDPVEYRLEGVTQIQVNERAGVTFASALRSVLRQDPDVIMVGEIRDPETAALAVQAAQTGHLVLSTVHSNDAVGVIPRLRALGVGCSSLAATLSGVVAQRLVRVLCEECKEPRPLSARDIQALGLAGQPVPEAVYAPKGCPACAETGYRGRTGVFELLVVDDGFARLLAAGVREGELRRYVRQRGMKTLREAALEKLFDGVTSVEEVLRVL